MNPWVNKYTNKFVNASNARGYIDHCVKPQNWTIVLGYDGKYWVVTNREASRLVKQQGFMLIGR